jgi:hypothetical protein
MGGAIPQPTGPWTQNQGFSQPVQNVVDPALAGAGAAASSFNAGNNPTYQGPGAADAANLQFQPANVAQSLYGQQMGLLEPGMKSQSDALDNSLKAMGYDTNSAGGAQTAENNLMNQQNLVRTQAANTAVGQAIPQGAQALAAQEGILGLGQSLGTTQFNTGMQSQLLPIQEAQGLTQTALAPSATLPGGAAQVPAIQPVDALGTAQQSYANQVAGYNANQATSSNNMNGLLGLAGTIGSIFMSDRSLKTDIAPVAERADGLNVYNYRYKWDQPGTRRTGLMADEVKKLYPNAVLRTPSGYDAVDYARV